jgi:hypothetical protein
MEEKQESPWIEGDMRESFEVLQKCLPFSFYIPLVTRVTTLMGNGKKVNKYKQADIFSP